MDAVGDTLGGLMADVAPAAQELQEKIDLQQRDRKRAIAKLNKVRHLECSH